MRKEINKFKDFLNENSEEKLNISDNLDNDLFYEDSELLLIEVVDKIRPFYLKYGIENTILFLESILDAIHHAGGEYFGE